MTIQRASIIAVCIIIASIAVGFGGRTLILGGTSETIVAAQSLEDQIKQAITSDTAMRGRSSLSQDTVVIDHIAERENGDWVIANVTGEGDNQQESSVVMQRNDEGQYDIVVSPGTDIDQDSLKQLGLPGTVIRLLAERGQVTDLTEGTN